MRDDTDRATLTRGIQVGILYGVLGYFVALVLGVLASTLLGWGTHLRTRSGLRCGDGLRNVVYRVDRPLMSRGMNDRRTISRLVTTCRCNLTGVTRYGD